MRRTKNPMVPISERLWSKVERRGPEECWPWFGAKGPTGYGLMSPDEDGDQRAHRIAYKQEHGTIPAGMVVMHICDNRACCNPRHLSVGTQWQNVSDAVRKGRHISGERVHTAKLSSEEVRTIRKLAARGVPRASLQEAYGVSQTTIQGIVTGKTWAAA